VWSANTILLYQICGLFQFIVVIMIIEPAIWMQP
jgi:hypothetical protein